MLFCFMRVTSLAITEDWQFSYCNVAYDIDETLFRMLKQIVEPWAVELSAAVLLTGGKVSPEEFDWLTRGEGE